MAGVGVLVTGFWAGVCGFSEDCRVRGFEVRVVFRLGALLSSEAIYLSSRVAVPPSPWAGGGDYLVAY